MDVDILTDLLLLSAEVDNMGASATPGGQTQNIALSNCSVHKVLQPQRK